MGCAPAPSHPSALCRPQEAEHSSTALPLLQCLRTADSLSRSLAFTWNAAAIARCKDAGADALNALFKHDNADAPIITLEYAAYMN